MKRTPEQLAAEREAVFRAIVGAEPTGIRRGDLCKRTGLDSRRVANALRWWCVQGMVYCYAYPRWSLTVRGLDRMAARVMEVTR